MPELPEAEVVRRGLERWTVGRRVEAVEVLDPRSLRRHIGGPGDFVQRLQGASILDAVRRGKFLWLPVVLASGDELALMMHLGMSGQALIQSVDQPDERHLKVRLGLSETPDGLPGQLRIVDQRIFGGMFLDPLEPTADGHPGGRGALGLPLIPEHAAHIARDPLDPDFDPSAFHAALRRRKTGIKRALLDQGLISGIGNIYADEALWSARLHYARPTETLTRPETQRMVEAVQDVMARALEAGGTSFDSLYVNINGESGSGSRFLAVYGLAGHPCRRCGTPIVREKFMNRSSHFCRVCQRKR